MPTSDPLTILLKHDHWATNQILDACAKLAPEQFHKRFDMGPGSLHDTLTHMLAAQRAWADMLHHREMRPRLEGTQQTVESLKPMFDESTADLTAAARSLDQTITRERGGKTYTFTRGAVLTHITTHGMHHRAQCLNMLRHVGVSPLPHSSVAEWTWLGDRE